MPINKLNQVPYNDFRLYEIIDPEQFDANNNALVAKIDELVDGVNTNETNITELLNTVLASTTDSDSGADKVGATPVPGIDGDTVQEILEGLKLAMDVTQLGQIVDGSITDVKLHPNNKIGSLSLLTTTDKTSVVNAINELNDNIVTVATPNKVLKLNADGKLPANITGSANALGGHDASVFITHLAEMASQSEVGHVQFGTTEGTAAEGNHNHDGVYMPTTPLAPVLLTANTTLDLSHAGKALKMTNASARTFTVPPNSSVEFPVGTVIGLIRGGTGDVSVVADSGVTIESDGGKLKLKNQHSTAALIKTATDTWTLTGSLKA